MEYTKILIVEDDVKSASLLGDYLAAAGFKVSVLYSGKSVTNEVRSNPPHLILLDIMLPDKNGMTICSEVRSFSKVPIIMLTAKVEEIDRVLGLELGADDYICKPFSPREVVSRVKAVLRRLHDYHSEPMTVVGPITIKPDSHYATIFGRQLDLTPSEFDLLNILATYRDKVVTRNDLISNLKRHYQDNRKRNIDSHIKNLRKKLENACPGAKVIKTIYGLGYTLNVSSIPVSDQVGDHENASANIISGTFD